MASKSFREVMAWQKAHAFVLAFYKTKPMFPDDEKFALIPQFPPFLLRSHQGQQRNHG